MAVKYNIFLLLSKFVKRPNAEFDFNCSNPCIGETKNKTFRK